MTFQIGDTVRKIGGNYQADGTIVSAFKTLAGDERYVFEFLVFPGMLHIFNGSQLELALDEFVPGTFEEYNEPQR